MSILKDEFLQEEAAIFKNYHLLNDCKITPAFLDLERRKGGYCNIVKIQVGINDQKEPVFSKDPKIIRDNMANFYSEVYEKQTVKSSENDIIDYLNSDGYSEPIKELNNRRIPDSVRD